MAVKFKLLEVLSRHNCSNPDCKRESTAYDESMAFICLLYQNINKYEQYRVIEYLYNLLNSNMYKTDRLSAIDMISLLNKFLIEHESDLQLDLIPYDIALGNNEEFVTYINKSHIDTAYSLVKTCTSIQKIVDDMYTYVLNKTKEFLDSVDPYTLSKAHYTVNLHNYLELIGVKDDSFKRLSEFALYTQALRIQLRSCFEDALIAINCKQLNHNVYFEYKPLVFSYDNERIQNELFIHLSRIYENSKDLFKQFIMDVNKSELTADDFKHVSQYSYLKRILSKALKNKEKGINILLYGEPGHGKTVLAKTLMTEITNNAYEIPAQENSCYEMFSPVVYSRESAAVNEIHSTARTRLYYTARRILANNDTKTLLLYDEAEDFFTETSNSYGRKSKAVVNDTLENNTIPTIWTTNNIYSMESSFLRRFTYILKIDRLPAKVYRSMVDKLLAKHKLEISKEIKDLCTEHRINLGSLNTIFHTYKLSGNKDLSELKEYIYDTLQGLRKGESIKRKVDSENIEFDHRLLNTSVDLDTITNRLKTCNTLAFSLLLHGVPGSGKSFYAKYLAKVLGLQVIKKKASDLESPFVGETEINIARAFEEARKEKAILIIDEGDHFISDRQKHTHSWENSRTEEMLQQIEAHEYPIVFTSNLMSNIDRAAMRRFTYKIEFKYMTKDQIKYAWEDYFPDAPLPDNITYMELTPGDFYTVYKRAKIEGFMSDTNRIWNELTEEVKLKTVNYKEIVL